MTTLNAFVWNQQKLGYVPHTSVSGEVFQPIKRSITTGSGASDGTTLIDTSGDSGAARTYNGRYWVKILSDTSKNEWRRVVSDDGAGTLTLEGSGNGFESVIASGVDYEIWKGPEAIINVTSSGGATDVRDNLRTEADDHWNGYWLCVISGSKRGEKAIITDFASSGGIFTCNGSVQLSASLTAGDVCVIRKFVEVEGLSVSLSEQYNARPMSRIDFAEGDGVVGARGGTVSFKIPAMASNNPAASSYAANHNMIQGLLTACGFDEIVGTSCTVTTGSTTTSINITAGQWERLVRPGGMVIHNGNPTFITDLTDGTPDVVTVSPALPTAPTSGDVLYATRSYFKNVSGTHYGCTLEWEVDGIRTTMFGCKGTVSIEAGPIVMFNFTFNIDHWIREKEIAPYTADTMYSTAPMIQGHDQRAWLSGTATSIGQFTASIDAETKSRDVSGAIGVNGRAGFQTVKTAGSCTFREIPNADTAGLQQIKRFEQRTAKAVVVAWGSHGNCVGVSIPVARAIEASHPQDNGGLLEVPLVLKAQDAGQIAYGSSNGTVSKLPDFCISIS